MAIITLITYLLTNVHASNVRHCYAVIKNNDDDRLVTNVRKKWFYFARLIFFFLDFFSFEPAMFVLFIIPALDALNEKNFS